MLAVLVALVLGSAFSTGFKHAALNALFRNTAGPTPVAPFASLHTADPGDSGANEVSGGSPAYARKSITFAAPSAGAITSSNTPVFDVPAGTTVTHVGFWTAATGGTFLGSDPVTNETFGAQGTYTLTDADIDLNA